MYKDIFGKTRQRLALHLHTTLSDGRKTPEEVAEIYKNAGYDAIAFTDHWHHENSGNINGLPIIAGAEYNIGGVACERGVYHILSLFSDKNPDVEQCDDAQTIIDKIHAAGGLAVLAHPVWSLNTPEMMARLHGIDATEIYNAVSEVGQSYRADSSVIVDMLAGADISYPILATDDAHYYGGKDDCKGWIMVESETLEKRDLAAAISERRFYATQGPEIHLSVKDGVAQVVCSPVSKICFATNAAWAPNRVSEGESLVRAEYRLVPADKFVRAFVIDKDGKTAWSNIVKL